MPAQPVCAADAHPPAACPKTVGALDQLCGEPPQTRRSRIVSRSSRRARRGCPQDHGHNRADSCSHTAPARQPVRHRGRGAASELNGRSPQTRRYPRSTDATAGSTSSSFVSRSARRCSTTARARGRSRTIRATTANRRRHGRGSWRIEEVIQNNQPLFLLVGRGGACARPRPGGGVTPRRATADRHHPHPVEHFRIFSRAAVRFLPPFRPCCVRNKKESCNGTIGRYL